LTVVNAYTQYQWGTELKPFDYDAFTLCMRKMNHVFAGKRIGLPQIGSHLAGGDWELIRPIIQKELKDCNVTVVIYKPE
jgi:O-acetyl-ADP-ribose deacetylase (regulator of RNase III)